MALRIPGARVDIVNDTGVIVPPLFERYPTYIGEGDPYRAVSDQNIVRSLGSVDSLPSITTVHELVSIGDLPGIAGYVQNTDYSLVGGNISWIPGGSAPTLGDTYYVTYTQNRPASAFVPTLYFDENLIYDDHGNGLRTNGNINDASVGGSLGLNAGSNGVIIAQLDLSAATDPDSPTVTELENAFIAMRDELNKVYDYKLFLVPMSSGTLLTTTAASIFFNHAVLASQPANKQERTVMAAMAKNTTYQQFATYAQAFAHERMVVPAVPLGTTRVVGYTGTYDMRFYNAVLAGKLCSVPIGRTISDEIMPNILFEDNFDPAELNYLVQRGVSPAKIRGEVVRNVLAITTDTTNALSEDLGVQDIKDYVKKYWREGLWAVYKNAPTTEGLQRRLTGSSRGILDRLIEDTVVAAWRSIAVSQDTAEPRKYKISAKVKPVFGLQWLDITFTFVLSFSP